MSQYEKRFYRDLHRNSNLTSYQIAIQESDLYIASTNPSMETAKKALLEARENIQSYIAIHPDFLSSLSPISLESQNAPVCWMLDASSQCSVGPMAAVAGAVSRYVGEALLKENDEVIVENGGDIFISSNSAKKILIYAGDSPISMKMAIEIPAGIFGVCTSAGKVGPSLSFGNADAAIVLSKNCALADAAATLLGNYIQSDQNLKESIEKIMKISGVLGAVGICGEKIAAAGQIKLVPAQSFF
ncbi:MAG: UPF0280 family protein [Eubacteriales bacterium]